MELKNLSKVISCCLLSQQKRHEFVNLSFPLLCHWIFKVLEVLINFKSFLELNRAFSGQDKATAGFK